MPNEVAKNKTGSCEARDSVPFEEPELLESLSRTASIRTNRYPRLRMPGPALSREANPPAATRYSTEEGTLNPVTSPMPLSLERLEGRRVLVYSGSLTSCGGRPLLRLRNLIAFSPGGL